MLLLLATALNPAQDIEVDPPRYLGIQGLGSESGIVADIDGDGDEDVFLVSGEIFWLEQGGAGEFVAIHSIDARDGFPLATSGDVDGDGDPDLLVCRCFHGSGSSLQWLENLGRGRFAAEPRLIETFAAADALDPRLVDVDQDGRIDILTRLSTGAEQDWYRGEGRGEFSPRATLASIPVPGARGAVGFDLGQDGDVDLIVPTDGNGLWTVENLGGSSFSPPVAFDAQLQDCKFIGFHDLNHDGRDDLVMSNRVPSTFSGEDMVVTYPGQTGGTFGARIDSYVRSPSEGPFRIPSIRDLDGDGDPDFAFATTGDDVAVLENLGAGLFGTPQIVPMTSQGDHDLLGLGEFDGTPGVDALLTTSGTYGSLQVLRGGTGIHFVTEERVLRWSRFDDVVLGDLDGDGDTDILQSGYEQRVGINPGNGQLESIQLPIDVQPATDTSLADLDGDGDQDIIAEKAGAVEWLENLGALTFSTPNSVASAGLDLEGLIGVDLDGDGLEDIVSRGVDLAWARNLGNGSFDPFALLGPAFSNTLSATFVDINGDGDQDLVSQARVPTGLELRVALDQTPVGGPASFAVLQVISYPGFDPMDVSPGDLDGDGDQDLLLSSRSNALQGNVLWLENDGAGTLSSTLTLLTDCHTCDSIQQVDLDADGDLDVFGVQSTGIGPLGSPSGSFWLENDGDVTSLQLRRIIEGPSREGVTRLVDLDGDGDLDVVSASYRLGVQLNQRFVGSAFCSPAVPNSTGRPGMLELRGSRFPEDNDLTLEVRSLPPAAFGMGVVGSIAGPPTSVQQSQGLLCLAAPMARLNAPGQIMMASNDGAFDISLDLSRALLGAGTSAVMPGDTWNFQVWYRDSNPAPTSNFTNAVAVEFR